MAENPERTRVVIVGSINMGYISETARIRTHNLFRLKCAPTPIDRSVGIGQRNRYSIATIFFVVVCPKPCSCPLNKTTGFTKLNCRGIRLKDHVLDKIPKNVVGIDLHKTGITQLHNDSFLNCINVETLDISYNHHLSVIHNAMFRDMPKLAKIVMTENNLSYSVSSFPDDTFEGLRRLKNISISKQTVYRKTNVSLKDFAFMMHRLPRTLETLKVDIPSRGGFSQQFLNFTNLSTLEIYNDINISITIFNDTFKYLRNIPLKNLKIRANHLSRVQPFAFQPLTALRTLDVKLYDMTVTDFYPALIGLQNTKLEKLILSTGSSSRTRSVTLNESFCENLFLPNLTVLRMDHAKLEGITSKQKNGCFSNLKKLKKLNLAYNFFTPESLNSTFNEQLYPTNLVELNISHQTGSSHHHSKFLRYKLPSQLETLDMSRIRHYTSKWITIELLTPTNLKYFYFRGNSVKVMCNITITRNKSSIPFEADFSRNHMISFTGSFNKSIKNGLKVVSLSMSENRLGRELAKNGDKAFAYFKDLSKLDLSANDITTLPDSIFGNNTCLTRINLARNLLSVISLRISHMRNLQILDLSHNLLSQLDTRFQNEIELIKSRSVNFTINMLGNPFQCSCETRQFLEWMYHKQSMFSFYEKYTCTLNNIPFAFKNITHMLDLLNFQCQQNLFLKVSAGLLAFLIFVMALSAFLYRHKWDVRFFCLKFVTNRKAYQELEESEEEYEYDAFVSFHSDDHDWVSDELQKNLDRTQANAETDDDLRFRFCIHERDFVPGGLIEENILRSIEASRKTIVVLSRNFLQSVWCEFELQIARKECIERGRDLIIAVMLEPLPDDTKISSSVERLVRKNTYIEWPTEEVERNHFWEQMRWALAKKEIH